jgi:lipopolysaccharide/colanic/teichoic acid biosynthesis glycosyltransferase
LDIEYARNKNLLMDLRIIFMTVPALLVQMWDSRQKKKAPAHVVPGPAAVSVRH